MIQSCNHGRENYGDRNLGVKITSMYATSLKCIQITQCMYLVRVVASLQRDLKCKCGTPKPTYDAISEAEKGGGGRVVLGMPR